MNKLLLVVLLFTSLSCSKETAEQAQQENLARRLGYNANYNGFSQEYPTQTSLHYFHDPRTDLCFASFWGGDWHGGPSLATVDCSIPRKAQILWEMP